jgi:hypothetical protein
VFFVLAAAAAVRLSIWPFYIMLIAKTALAENEDEKFPFTKARDTTRNKTEI